MVEPKDRRPLIEALERFWSEAAGKVSQAEDEAQKLAQRVSTMAGWSQDEVRRHTRDLAERLVAQRKSVETSVEDAVKRSLTRLRVPRREEVAQLSARLEAVARRVEALTR